VISDSSLSIATMCGVERTFASADDWSAWMRTPMEETLMPRFLSSVVTGPAKPVRKPPREIAEPRLKDETRPGWEESGMMPVSPL